MAQQVAEALGVSESRVAHLQPMEIAGYVDGVVTGEDRARIDAHLAECAECRDEVVDAIRIAATMSGPKLNRSHLWIPAIAAAAVVLLMVRSDDRPEPGMEHREAPVTTTVAPRAVMPVGRVDSAATVLWSSVPRSDRYHLRMFDADGSVVWEMETTDTTANIPASVALVPGRAYFWKVEAQTGFGRSAATDLIEFSVRRARRP